MPDLCQDIAGGLPLQLAQPAGPARTRSGYASSPTKFRSATKGR